MAGLLLLFLCIGGSLASSPNIIFILVDDAGYYDIVSGYYDTGITNSLAITPTINRLANEGVFFNQSYVQSMCTPSRAAILTGKYPFMTGMQGEPIDTTEQRCLDTSLTILPEKLKELGYATHAVGKWHLGYCSHSCTPTHRGFDSFFGMFNGRSNHYTRVVTAGDLTGADLHENEQPVDGTSGIHSTVLYTERAVDIISTHEQMQPLFLWLSYQAPHSPIQVPEEYELMYEDITEDRDRRVLLGMMTQVDDSMKKIIAALEDNNMVDDTLLIFMSDNGGTLGFGGYNHPLRGSKGTLWEGGVRAQTVLWGGVVQKKGYVNDGLLHAVDWFPSLISMAGGNTDDFEIDGIDSSDTLLEGAASKRKSMIYHISEVEDPYQGGIRSGKYKFLVGYIGRRNGWYIPPELNTLHSERTLDEHTPKMPPSYNFYFPEEWDRFLFDVEADPEERVDLINDLPAVAEELEWLLAEYDEKRVPADRGPLTPELADPERFGGFWSPGWC